MIAGFALFEYYSGAANDKGLLFVGILLGIITPAIIYLFGLQGFPVYLAFAVFLVFTYCLLTHTELTSAVNRIGIGVLGVVYIAFLLSYLILIRDLEEGRLWILFLVSIVAANDIFAYYTGKNIGRHKLAPLVSPNKTIEGALGGLTGGLAIAVIFQQVFFITISPKEAAILAVSIGILGQLGDLFESLIKRSIGVKDFGNILPGHGGVLDRVDSLIFPAPVLYYYISIFKA